VILKTIERETDTFSVRQQAPNSPMLNISWGLGTGPCHPSNFLLAAPTRFG